MAFFAESAMRRTRPICTYMLFGHAKANKSGDGPEQRHRHGEDDGERRNPALVLPGEHEEDEKDREREDIIDRVTRDLFLERHAGP